MATEQKKLIEFILFKDSAKPDRIIHLTLLGIYIFISIFFVITLFKPVWLTEMNTDERKFEATIIMNDGIHYAQTGKHKEAISIFEMALERAPELPQIKINLATSLASMGEFQKAVVYLKQVLNQKNVNKSNIYYMLSEFYKQLKDTSESEKSFQDAHINNNYNTQKYRNLGIKLMSEMKWQESYDALLKQYEYRSKIKTYFEEMLYFAYESLEKDSLLQEKIMEKLRNGIDDTELAKYDTLLFNRFLNSHHPFAVNCNQLGFDLAKMGRIEEAKVYFNKALAISPKYQDPLINLEFLEKGNIRK